MTPIIESKLPNVGTTIFTVMSALAQECQAVNLGQGFPDFACDPQLVDAVTDAMKKGLNQYPSMLGVLELRQAVSDKIQQLYGRRYDPVSEITITAGATQAIINAVLAVVRPGDEVIVPAVSMMSSWMMQVLPATSPMTFITSAVPSSVRRLSMTASSASSRFA